MVEAAVEAEVKAERASDAAATSARGVAIDAGPRITLFKPALILLPGVMVARRIVDAAVNLPQNVSSRRKWRHRPLVSGHVRVIPLPLTEKQRPAHPQLMSRDLAVPVGASDHIPVKPTPLEKVFGLALGVRPHMVFRLVILQVLDGRVPFAATSIVCHRRG